MRDKIENFELDFVVSIIILSCCVGSLTSTVYGWMFLGGIMFFNAVIGTYLERKRKNANR